MIIAMALIRLVYDTLAILDCLLYLLNLLPAGFHRRRVTGQSLSSLLEFSTKFTDQAGQP